MLHSRVLRYIDEVARLGSIRAAGDRLNIAPSAINKHILQLEQVIGAPLFERLPRGLRLTSAGEVLVAHVRRTLKEYSQVEAEIRDIKGLQSGQLIISTTNGLAEGIVANTAASFCARHPRITLSIRNMPIREIVKSVVDGEADLGFAFNLPPTNQLETLVRLETRLGAVVSSDHPLAGLEMMPLKSCIGYPLIFADRSMVMHSIVSEAFATAGFVAEPTFITNSIEAMKSLAALSDGIAFLSKFDVTEEQDKGTLSYVSIRDGTFSKNVLSLVQSVKRGHALAPSIFVEDLKRSLHLPM